MNSDFYIPQQAYLKNIIHSVWQTDGYSSFNFETIIPMGITEIIFDLGCNTAVQASIAGKEYQLPRCFINGFNTFPVERQLPPQNTCLGIRLHPLMIKKLFGVPAHEFSNLVIDLDLIDHSMLTLWHQLGEQKTFPQRIDILARWFKGKSEEMHPQEKLLTGFLENPLPAAATVNELAQGLCYSTRHLSRKIQELTAMNTEDILRYKRYVHGLHLIHQPGFSLTAIAYQCGFTDQSHFIKSFKEFAGLTPGEYRQRKSNLPGHIYENVRQVQF
jgi:AraC-like DNA-binding protein